jgi:hypothetical protein
MTQAPDVTESVNSLGKNQDRHYADDDAGAYHDGPPIPGAKPVEPFCKLESPSSAGAPAQGTTLSYTARTLHLTGPERTCMAPRDMSWEHRSPKLNQP